MTADRTPILETRNLIKRFFGTLALDRIGFSVKPGEIHALIGENGAGKSTLIKILAGVYEPDAGEILMNGETVHPHTQSLPLSFVHQDLGLVDDLSVGENVALVAGFPLRRGLIDWNQVWLQAGQIYHLMDVEVLDPRTLVGTLSAAEKAVLGIVRALSRKASVLVLDEPTAALPEPDALQLFRILKNLRDVGTSIVYVSHRLNELFGLVDRITVFRDGGLVRTIEANGVTPEALVEDMLGRPVETAQTGHSLEFGRKPVLKVENFWVHGRGPLDFELARNEIVGLVGLTGAGQEHVGRAIFGALRPDRGSILLDNKKLPETEAVAERISRGIVLLPSDRIRESIFSGMSITENLFPNPRITGIGSWAITSPRQERNRTGPFLDRFDVRPRNEAALIDWLSGGNQQKVAIARWLAANGRVLILEEPTAGVDIGAKLAIHGMIRDAAREGAAVLVVSSDFEEVAMLCDRALVVSRGRIAGQLQGTRLTVDELVARSSLGFAAAAGR